MTPARHVLFICILAGIVLLAGSMEWGDSNPAGRAFAAVESGSGTQTAEDGSIWGEIKLFTDTYVVLRHQGTFQFANNVVIDTYSLKPDDRGTVRLVLDAHNRVRYLFFYGIDMPDAFRLYSR